MYDRRRSVRDCSDRRCVSHAEPHHIHAHTHTTSRTQRPGSWVYDSRITYIYASSEATIRNARRNWGIRKELGSFEFTTTATWWSSSTRVRVRDGMTGALVVDLSYRTHHVCTLPVGLGMLGKLSRCGVVALCVYLAHFDQGLTPTHRYRHAPVPFLVERRIDEEGRPVGDDEWLRTSIRGLGFSAPVTFTVHPIPDLPAVPLFPPLDQLGFLPLGFAYTGNFHVSEPVLLLP